MSNFLDNVKKIYINEEQDWFVTHPYNGSWHPIKMETKDGNDWSIPIYENWYEFLNMSMEQEDGSYQEPTDEDVKELFPLFIDNLKDWGIRVTTIYNFTF